MLSGVIVAAAIAAVVERSVFGQHPVFEIQQHTRMGPASSLVSYAMLGLFSAFASVAFTDSLLGLRASIQEIHRRAQVGASRDRRSVDWNPSGRRNELWLKTVGHHRRSDTARFRWR